MIYDYTQFKSFDAYYGEGFETTNRELIDVFNTHCPYCGNKLTQEFYFQRYDNNFKNNHCIDQCETIYYCENDGWWQHKINERQDIDPKAWYAVIHEGVLAQYSESGSDVPINTLQDYIRKHPKKIANINDKKMEELVASVFKDFYECETKVVGKSSDGGVDVILINSDSQTMIQVKRRMSIDKTEAVSHIRELLGATLLSQSKNCIFVSTANKFSKAAEKTASRAIELGLVQSYELIDYHKFIDMLRTTKNSINGVWENVKVLNKLKSDEHYGLAYV